MSHLVTMKSEMRNQQAIRNACAALKLKAPETGKLELYDGSAHEGTLVRLPGWQYPVCIKADGQLAFDNYNGHWGSLAELERLQQRYAAEVVKLEMGEEWEITEVMQPNGELLLTLEQGGGW